MDNLATLRRAARYGAYGMSAASAVLTAFFAWSQSEYVAISAALVVFLVICSLCSDYIGLFAVDAWRARNWPAMGVLGCGLAVAVTLNLMSNVGSVGWQRTATITDARVHNAKYEDTRDSVATAKANLASAKRQLEALQTQHAWAASANAIQLRQNIAELQQAADREAARGGCGPKCEAIKARIISMTENLGVIERREDLSKRIAATVKWLEDAKQKAAGQTVKVAAADSQASFFGALFTASLTPSSDVKTWTTYGIGTWMAWGLVFLPMVLAFAGFKTDNVSRETVRKTFSGKIEPLTPAPAAPMGFLGGNSTINIHDEDGRKLLEAIRAYASNKAITA